MSKIRELNVEPECRRITRKHSTEKKSYQNSILFPRLRSRSHIQQHSIIKSPVHASRCPQIQIEDFTKKIRMADDDNEYGEREMSRSKIIIDPKNKGSMSSRHKKIIKHLSQGNILFVPYDSQSKKIIYSYHQQKNETEDFYSVDKSSLQTKLQGQSKRKPGERAAREMVISHFSHHDKNTDHYLSFLNQILQQNQRIQDHIYRLDDLIRHSPKKPIQQLGNSRIKRIKKILMSSLPGQMNHMLVAHRNRSRNPAIKSTRNHTQPQ